MGGKKKGGIGGFFKKIASDVAGATTLGVVDVNSGKINLNPEDAAANYSSGITANTTINGATEIPKAQTAEDPAEQALRAKAEAEANLMKEINLKNTGLGLTNLGGSFMSDNSNLKKKKLLGE
jgi:hypothetical protein